MNQELTKEEAIEREKIEKQIEAGTLTFIEVGEALNRIHKKKLYRNTHKSFKEYMEQQWGRSPGGGYLLMNAVEVAKTLSSARLKPTNESQVRPLNSFKGQPEIQQQIWEEASQGKQKITAAEVAQTAQSHKGKTLSLLPYFDSKIQISKAIAQAAKRHQFTGYCEPFGNNGCTYFRLWTERILTPKHRICLNDNSGTIGKFMAALRENETQLVSAISQIISGIKLEEILEKTDNKQVKDAIKFAINQLEHFLDSHPEIEEDEKSYTKRLSKYLSSIPQIAEAVRQALIDNKPAIECLKYYKRHDLLFLVDIPQDLKKQEKTKIAKTLSGIKAAGVIVKWQGEDPPFPEEIWEQKKIAGYNILIRRDGPKEEEPDISTTNTQKEDIFSQTKRYEEPENIQLPEEPPEEIAEPELENKYPDEEIDDGESLEKPPETIPESETASLALNLNQESEPPAEPQKSSTGEEKKINPDKEIGVNPTIPPTTTTQKETTASSTQKLQIEPTAKSTQSTQITLEEIKREADKSPIGKKTKAGLYIHKNATGALSESLQSYEQEARKHIKKTQNFTIIKISTESTRISYLFYPDFEAAPHPALKTAIQVHLPEGKVSSTDYTQWDNPPILHRKETLILEEHTLYRTFAELTKQEEEIGLLENPKGNLKEWEQQLAEAGVQIQRHKIIETDPYKDEQFQKFSTEVSSWTTQELKEGIKLIDKLIGKKTSKPGTSLQEPSLKELRWKTAMSRTELSKPARLMLELGHLTEEESHFDYGCGKGGDIERLKAKGYQSTGWDPHFFPNNPIQEADVVTCLFVLNVIEDIPERLETMVKATKLARKKAILSVRVEKPPDITFSWGDGYITSQGCFQKQFTNGEFLGIIRQYFQQEPEIIAPGIAVINRE